jgi:hypothetical protein
MQENRAVSSPVASRVGMLTASVLMVFALTRIVQSPRFTLIVSLPGFYFAYPLTLGAVITLFAAALTASGMDWLTREHPALGEKSNVEHLMLPTLTTFAAGTLLSLPQEQTAWWVGLGFSAALLTGVFIAEYIAIHPSASSYVFARAGLNALSYVLFFILAAALRFSGARMFLLTPLLFLTAGLISLRILRLDGAERWDFPWSIGIGLACAQIGAGLHYWQLNPIQYGLALTAPLYALTMLSSSLAENIPPRRAVIAPALAVGLGWMTAIFLR